MALLLGVVLTCLAWETIDRDGWIFRLLDKIGFVRVDYPNPFRDDTLNKPEGTVRWPFHVSPWRMWPHLAKHEPWFGVFRNVEGVVKWVPGRVLPRRWGVRFIGFEFGDRG